MDEQIFISYAHEDEEKVSGIVGIIENASEMKVWIDKKLRGGENYFSAIANQIMECEYFVFVVSAFSVSSKWCKRELQFAAEEGKDIIAVWIENVAIPGEVKIVIQNTHYINCYSATDEAFFEDVRRAFSNELVDVGMRSDLEHNQDWNVYFLENQKVKRIEQLLSEEARGKYSACFRPENACLLGLAYELGVKVSANLRKAEFYYKVSAHGGNYDGKYLHAALRRKHDSDENAALYLPEMIDAAKHQSVYALTCLGDDYYYGKNGCGKDVAKAYEFWRNAAAAGGATAMYYMAYGHRKGECVEKDVDLAYMYALMATEYGFPRAYRILAFMYEDGELSEKDDEKALALYEEAVKRGDYQSLCYQGWIYGEKGDLDKKRELYERALELAEEGKITTGLPYYRMGLLYLHGDGVERDLVKAVEYYLQAAERRHSGALKHTVFIIKRMEDDEKREMFLRRAYELDCEGAACALGDTEAKKNDSERLSGAAVDYYTKGAENGDVLCAERLIRDCSVVLGHGDGKKEDRVNAIKWFRFLFANADEVVLNRLREDGLLTSYYYAYAVELDYDPETNLPDREFVLFYFRKALEEDLVHLRRIANFAIGGYLFPDESDSGLQMDVVHAADVLKLVEEHVGAFYDHVIDRMSRDEGLREWNELCDDLVKGYTKIAECYRTGRAVKKNRRKAEECKLRAKQIELKMQRTACAE